MFMYDPGRCEESALVVFLLLLMYIWRVCMCKKNKTTKLPLEINMPLLLWTTKNRTVKISALAFGRLDQCINYYQYDLTC